MKTSREDLPLVDFRPPEAWTDPRLTLMPALHVSKAAQAPDGTLWILDHAGVVEVLKNRAFEAPNLATRHGDQDPVIRDWAARLMGSMNGDAHRRTRSLVQKTFTARMAEDLRPKIAEIVDQLFARARRDQTIAPLGELPGRVMTYLLGVPSSEYDQFIGWVDDLAHFFSVDLANPAVSARVKGAITGLDTYLRGLIARTDREPGPDLLGQLLEPREDGQLSLDEVVVLATNLLSAGTDTVRSSIEIFCYLLATHPDQMRLLRQRPDLVPQAVEELLRYEPAVPFQLRVAAADVVIGDVEIRAGERVMLSLITADRDPEAWSDADVLDIARIDPPRAQIFGGGPHVCLGAALARTELQEFLAALIAGGDTVALRADGHFEPYQHLRRLEGLRIALLPAGIPTQQEASV